MRLLRWIGYVIVGLFATVGALLVVAVVGAALAWRNFMGPTEPVPDRAVLQADLRAGIVETEPYYVPLISDFDRSLTLRDLIETLHAAADDERVAGLIVRVNGSKLSLAQIQELRDAVAAFRAGGKRAVAFAETFGETGSGTLDYYLASAFDEVWLQPSGELDITGILIEQPFMRELLTDLGVVPEFAAREDYKSAVEMFTRDSMSPAHRRNLEQLLRSWMDQIAGDIAADRALDSSAVQDLIDRAPHSAAAAIEAGLVDGLAYSDEIEAAAIEQAGDRAAVYDLADYAWQMEAPADALPVALVYGVGAIHLGTGESGFGGSGNIDADVLVDALRKARAVEDVAAVVLRVDSPGGSYVASDTIWREVERTREAGIPVVVSMGNVAASGGYFIAAPASAIVADPATVTGSIGVVSGKFVLDDLWAEIGIDWDAIGFGANAGIFSPNRPFTEPQWQQLNETLDRIYADFLQRVAEGRDLDAAAVRASAQGQIWSGEDALERGLIDELGGLHRAIEVALEEGGHSPDASYDLIVVRGDRFGVDSTFEESASLWADLRSATTLIAEFSRWLAIRQQLSNGPALLADPALSEPLR
ncbi:MAG: signal peptide peptidase SppA [Rhodospirillaceae bacterium]|nr:signal peptide peptidase SppA [Rhodospirillaceae bacterium]